MTSNEVKIGLFGSLRVRRSDGSDVDPREWCTGKTADLLRLLAVHGGRPVPIDTIVEALWPRVDRTKGSASLRTAICQIRRVMRADCIARHHDGLALRPALVDVVTFTRLAAECRRLVGLECWTAAVAVAREAEALYVGDLSAHDSSLEMLAHQRSAMRGLRLQLLLDAADASVQLKEYVDGVDLARRAIAVDPFSERAYRALIRSHAGTGEISRALAAYEQCRASLAEELGVDPHPQTQALRWQLLKESSRPAEQPMAAVVTEASHRVSLLELIAHVAAATGHPTEAEEASQAARSMARRHGLAIVKRGSSDQQGPQPSKSISAGPLGIRELVRELNRDVQRVPHGVRLVRTVG